MKVLDRYLIREIVPSFLVALSFIVFLLFMNQIFYLVDVFISKDVPLLVAMKVLFYLLPAVVALALPLAFMAGVLGGLARLSSDGEIEALKVLGLSPRRVLKPVFILGLVFWLIGTSFTFWLMPAANYRWLQTMVNSVLTRITLEVEPGHFIESLPGRVLFVQAKEKDGTWRNVFVYQQKEPDKAQITLSRSGQLSLPPEKKEAWLYLADGINYGFDLKSPDIMLVNNFRKLVQVVDLWKITQSFSLEKKSREKNIKELFEDRAKLRKEETADPRLRRLTELELHKRFSLPSTCLIFVFLGVGLGWRRWRGGRLTGYALSVIVLLTYYALLIVGENAAIKGKQPAALAMWLPNLLILVFGLFFYFSSYRVESDRWQTIFFRFGEWRKKLLRKNNKVTAPSEVKTGRNLFWPALLDRYLVRRFFKMALLIFFVLIFILVLITFFQNLELVKESQKPLKLLIAYIWYKLPEFSLLTGLVAVLIACSLALGYLYRKNEIAAMITAGFSYYRIILPLLVAALILVGPGFLLQDRIITRSNARAEEIWSYISDRPIRTFSYFSHYWIRGKEDKNFYHYDLVEPKTRTIGNFLVLEMEEKDFRLRKMVFAKQAKIEKDGLQLTSGWTRIFDQASSSYFPFETQRLELKNAESYFLKEWKEPATMTISELKLYSQDLIRMGASATRFSVEAEFRKAFSLAFFILVIIALIAVNLTGGRGFLFPLAISLSAGFVYWQMMAIFRSLGMSGVLSPFLAAWSPQIIFFLLSLYFLLRVRT